jgi:hypothetical protein
LQKRDSFGDRWLLPVQLQGTLVVGQRLRRIARAFPKSAECGPSPGIRLIQLNRRLKVVLRGFGIAEFFVQSRELHAGFGGSRIASGPILHQSEGAIGTLSLDQQHGESAMAVGVVFVPVETLVVQIFRLG